MEHEQNYNPPGGKISRPPGACKKNRCPNGSVGFSTRSRKQNRRRQGPQVAEALAIQERFFRHPRIISRQAGRELTRDRGFHPAAGQIQTVAAHQSAGLRPIFPGTSGRNPRVGKQLEKPGTPWRAGAWWTKSISLIWPHLKSLDNIRLRTETCGGIGRQRETGAGGRPGPGFGRKRVGLGGAGGKIRDRNVRGMQTAAYPNCRPHHSWEPKQKSCDGRAVGRVGSENPWVMKMAGIARCKPLGKETSRGTVLSL